MDTDLFTRIMTSALLEKKAAPWVIAAGWPSILIQETSHKRLYFSSTLENTEMPLA